MIKKILLPVDNSELSKKVLPIGIELSKKLNALLLGMSIVDVKGISKDSSGAGPGAGSFAKKLEEEKLSDAKQIASDLIKLFEEKANSNGVKYKSQIREGDPVEVILNEAELSDLVLLPIRTYFKYETQDKPCDTFEKVVQKSPIPVLAISEDTTNLDFDVLIAYDGSFKSKNVLRSFAPFYSEIKNDNPVSILYVTKENKESKNIIAASEYLNNYDIKSTCLIKDGKPRQVIYKTAKEFDDNKNTVLVIGTNGKNELTDYIFGSSIKKMLDDGSISLFIYH